METSAASEIFRPADWWEIPSHEGADYHEALRCLHAALRPATYFEIGTETGGSLILAQCASLAVDLAFRVNCNVAEGKLFCLLYQMTSDAFFATHDPRRLLGGPVDLAFLDGMHNYEYLLRDFINTERVCRPGSVIVLHDCLPTDAHVARREGGDQHLRAFSAHPEWWAGDVWKTTAILRRARPDLTMHAFGVPPTGLVLVTGLDPASYELARDYEAHVAGFAAAGPEAFAEHVAALRPLGFSAFDAVVEGLGRRGQ
jgi:predicted O-methyltransferase YrrM